MSVLHEVQVADAVDVDRRHRRSTPARHGNALPPSANTTGCWPEPPIELVAAPIDRPDDRVERDLSHTEIALTDAPQRRDHRLEREHDRYVVTFAPQAGRELVQSLAATLASEDRSGVRFGEPGAHSIEVTPSRDLLRAAYASSRSGHEIVAISLS